MLNRLNLEPQGCTTPGCDCGGKELFFHAGCHPGAKLEALYVKDIGALILICSECKSQIAAIEVALGGGPTGEGEDALGGRGGLNVAVMITAGHIVLDFGTNLTWVGMTPDEADATADKLKELAAEIRRSYN